MFGLGDAMPNTIHVTVPDAFRGRKPGVTVHQARVALQDALERGVVRRGEFIRASERYPQNAAFLSELT